jgi:hypothetical protein
MSAPTDEKTSAPAVLAVPLVLKALRTQWMERLTPALVDSGLLSDLIGMIAEYAAVYPLRWNVSDRAVRVVLSGPFDEDGCSRTMNVENLDYTQGTDSQSCRGCDCDGPEERPRDMG